MKKNLKNLVIEENIIETRDPFNTLRQNP